MPARETCGRCREELEPFAVNSGGKSPTPTPSSVVSAGTLTELGRSHSSLSTADLTRGTRLGGC